MTAACAGTQQMCAQAEIGLSHADDDAGGHESNPSISGHTADLAQGSPLHQPNMHVANVAVMKQRACSKMSAQS